MSIDGTENVEQFPKEVRKSRVGRFYGVLTDPRTRSRVSNATVLMDRVDGRSALARRFRDILAQIVVDQGDSGISEAKMALIRRFCATVIMAEAIETELVEGREVNVEKHALLVSSLVRLAGRIGIDRKARDISPSLGDYLRERDQPERPEQPEDPRRPRHGVPEVAEVEDGQGDGGGQ